VLVHGIAEHAGRYAHVAEALVKRGYAVYAVDHRGHGESQGVRALVDRFDYLVEDLHLLVRKASDAARGSPTFMIGHSMGALIALHYALRHQAELDGLVVSGAALQFGDAVSPVLKRLAGLIAALAPRLPVTSGHAGAESVLSRDPAVQARFDADPLCYQGKHRARTGYELLMAAAAARARLEQLSLPLLIMHGAADTFTNPAGSQQLYERARSTDKTLKLWPECRHEIFNEPEKAEVIAFTLDWMDERVRRVEQQRARGEAGA
jgi:alpha-beta hydrolase superfamily lysophospholipase